MKFKKVIKKHTKPRQTRAKQIKDLVSTDIRAAMMLAERQRKLSEVETQLNLYYQSQDELKQLTSGIKSNYQIAHELIGTWTEDRKAMNARLINDCAERDKERLIKLLLNALNSRDATKFFEVGDAIEFLQTIQPSDRYRPQLLRLKWTMDKHGDSLPIRDVACLIGWHDMDSADGFAQLRRLCVEIKFPLRPSRQTSG